MKGNISVCGMRIAAGIGLTLGAWAATVVLAVVGGCKDVSTDLDRLPQRPVRAAPKPLGTASQPSGRGATKTAGSQPAGPVDAGRAETRKAPAVTGTVEESAEVAGRGYQQVVLISEAMPAETPPGMRYVALKNAPAQEVGGVVSWLYPPAGPIGSRERYDLIYPSEIEADAAGRAAMDLDVPPVKAAGNGAASSSGRAAFNLGIGLLYRQAGEERLSRERLRQAEAALVQALGEKNLPSAQRWAAGMIAGGVAAERLRDLEAAKRYFSAAEAQTEPGSLERMAAWLGQANAALQNGEPQSARRLLEKVLTAPAGLRGTEVFDRARRMKVELERGH